MTFSVYVPPAALHGREEGKKGGGGNSVPVVVFLSGLTCTDENFSTKSGAQRAASELGIALVIPDTSPRGLKVDGEDDSTLAASTDGGLGAARAAIAKIVDEQPIQFINPLGAEALWPESPADLAWDLDHVSEETRGQMVSARDASPPAAEGAWRVT